MTISATVQVRIRGYQFAISAPYVVGQRMGEAEVQQLNDLRADNIRNNLTKPVLEALAPLPKGTMLSPEAIASLQALISDYDSKYQLQLKHQARPRVGQIEAEARAIAEARLDEQLRQHGMTPAEEVYSRLLAEMMTLPEVQELARERVVTKAKVLEHNLGDLL